MPALMLLILGVCRVVAFVVRIDRLVNWMLSGEAGLASSMRVES